MTNSQQSTTQNQSPQKRLRIEQQEDGTATTTTTTRPTQQDTEEEREEMPDDMMEDKSNEIKSQIEKEQHGSEHKDETQDGTTQDCKTTKVEQTDTLTTKTYNNDTTMNKGHITTPTAEGNFEHQFENKNKDKLNSDLFPGRNHGESQQ
jgi:hypothetical protein